MIQQTFQLLDKVSHKKESHSESIAPSSRAPSSRAMISDIEISMEEEKIAPKSNLIANLMKNKNSEYNNLIKNTLKLFSEDNIVKLN